MYWSTPLWDFIHTISIKCVNDKQNLDNVFILIRFLCFFIPCNECRQHSTNYFKHNSIINNEISNYYFTLHNVIKKRKRIRQTNIKILEKYKDYDVKEKFIRAVMLLKLSKESKMKAFISFKLIKLND